MACTCLDRRIHSSFPTPQEYARYQGNVSKDAIAAIGVCAEKIESVKPLCGNILLALVKSGRGKLTAYACFKAMTEMDACLIVQIP